MLFTKTSKSLSALSLATTVFAFTITPAVSADHMHQIYQPAYLQNAVRLLEAEEPLKAIEILSENSEGEKSQQDKAENYGLQCQGYLALQQPNKAQRFCLKAIETSGAKTNWADYNNLGEAYLKRGKLSEAETSFKQAASLNRSQNKSVKHTLFLAKPFAAL